MPLISRCGYPGGGGEAGGALSDDGLEEGVRQNLRPGPTALLYVRLVLPVPQKVRAPVPALAPLEGKAPGTEIVPDGGGLPALTAIPALVNLFAWERGKVVEVALGTWIGHVLGYPIWQGL